MTDHFRGRFAPSLLVFAVFVAFPPSHRACGQEAVADGLAIDGVRLGFAGAFKVGKWTPVEVTVEASRPMTVQLSVEAPDPDGSPASQPVRRAKLGEPGRHQLWGVFKIGRLEGPVRIRIEADGETLASRQLRLTSIGAANHAPALRQDVYLVATLGKPAGFETDDLLHVVELEDGAQLPPTASGYETLDALVIAGGYDVGAERSTAIREWVRLGGHLVVAVGSEINAYRESPLAEWVPVRVLEEASRLPQLSGLESFSGTNTRILFKGRQKAARLRPQAGKVLISGLDGPLLVRAALGFGRVSFFGLDLDRPPLSSWDPISAVGRKLIVGNGDATSSESRSGHRRLGHSGITDLATQLHAVREDFPRVRRVSTWTVMGLLFVYLVVIGPVDYLIVHRVLNRPHLTWISFPLLVLVAGCLAAWGASAANGDRLRVNQLDVVDVDAVSNTIRSQTWATIYSPQTRRYRVDVQANDLAYAGPNAGNNSSSAVGTRPRVAWYGVPENVIGGMYRPAGLELAKPSYSFAQGARRVENLPITLWSTKSLTAGWDCSDLDLIESDLESRGYGRLTGTIMHRMSAPITDWILAYRHTVYRPAVTGYNQGRPTLRPLQRWSPNGPNVRQRELNGYLTGAVAKATASREGLAETIHVEKTPYDALSRNSDQIMRILTFHAESGGTEYTGLENNSLRTHDLSPLIEMERAVLIGRIEMQAAQISLNGEAVELDRHWAYVRIVLPVKPQGGVPAELENLEDAQSSTK